MKPVKLIFGIGLALMSFGAEAKEVACGIPDNFELEIKDISRMARLEITRSMGLGAALVMEPAADRGTISSLFSEAFTSIEDPDKVIGRFQCRTIKLGGNLPGIVYGWFDCEVFPEEAVLVIRKTSGSQRFFGVMSPAGNGLAYRGAAHYGYEEQVRFYGADPERDQVGCFSAVGADMDHFVLEIPAPKFESVHNVIEFRRVN